MLSRESENINLLAAAMLATPPAYSAMIATDSKIAAPTDPERGLEDVRDRNVGADGIREVVDVDGQADDHQEPDDDRRTAVRASLPWDVARRHLRLLGEIGCAFEAR